MPDLKSDDDVDRRGNHIGVRRHASQAKARNRRAFAILVAIGLGTAATVWIRQQSQPVRIIELSPSDGFAGVSDAGPLFTSFGDRGTLYVIDAATGKKHPLLHGSMLNRAAGPLLYGSDASTKPAPKNEETPTSANLPEIPGTIVSTSATGSHLLVICTDRAPTSAREPQTGGTSGPGARTLGPQTSESASVEEIPSAELTRSQSEAQSTTAKDDTSVLVEQQGPFSIYVVDLRTPKYVMIASHVASAASAVCGDTVYWVKRLLPAPNAATGASVNGTARRVPTTGSYDVLIASSLDGSVLRETEVRSPAIQRVAGRGAIEWFDRLIPGAQGVFWITRERSATTLHYLRNGEKKDHAMAWRDAIGTPVDFSDRIYWVEQAPARQASGNGPPSPSPLAVMSAPWTLDGRSTLLQVNTKARQTDLPGRGLVTTNGRLYLVAWDGTTEAGVRPPADYQDISPETRPRVSLFRVEITPGTHVSRISTLPPGVMTVWLAGGNCYFEAPENKENWFDLSGSGLQRESSVALFRVRAGL